MKKTVFIFGTLSGLVATLFLIITMLAYKKGNFEHSMLVGYATMILSLSFIFFGVRAYRDKHNQGLIGFGRAFGIGMLIFVISTLFYVLTWEILYFNFMHDFLDHYAQCQIQELRSSGASEAQIQEMVQSMETFKKQYDNPLFNAAVTFLEPLPVGLLISLITALVLKRKQPKALTA